MTRVAKEEGVGDGKVSVTVGCHGEDGKGRGVRERVSVTAGRHSEGGKGRGVTERSVSL